MKILSFTSLFLIPIVELVDSTEVVIFYNAYFPEYPDLALDIVKEQLKYRENSTYPQAPLHYVTIGKDVGELENCENCRKLKHFNIGNETRTLSYLYRYCYNHQNETVAYIHNKGSFHENYRQGIFRRMLTKSVFSNECLLMKTPQTTKPHEESTCKCNICSARFSPIPHLHTSGNMWVSKCSYVAKLIHPSLFQLAMHQMAKSAPIQKFGNVSNVEEHIAGLGRYASEHWIHSHPDMCPCDVYPNTRYRFGYEPLPQNDDWVPDLSKAPRHSTFNRNAVFVVRGERSTEDKWFTIEGRKYEWKFLYGKIPDKESWAWIYYPHSRQR